MATEGAERPRDPDDKHQLLVKLQERKVTHKQRHPLHRAAVVVLGFLIVAAGIVMSGPGVPGPGIAVILVGLGFLALEFDRAERLLERAIMWADRAADRAQRTTPAQRALAAALVVLAFASFVAAALLWDIPLLPL
jgi:uncharacterized protein (TIGR02611 family)